MTDHAFDSVPSLLHLLKQVDRIAVLFLNDRDTRLRRDMQVRTHVTRKKEFALGGTFRTKKFFYP